MSARAAICICRSGRELCAHRPIIRAASAKKRCIVKAVVITMFLPIQFRGAQEAQAAAAAGVPVAAGGLRAAVVAPAGREWFTFCRLAGNLKIISGENQEGLMLFYGLLIFLVLVLIIMLIRTHLHNRALFRFLSGRVIFKGPEYKDDDSKPDAK